MGCLRLDDEAKVRADWQNGGRRVLRLFRETIEDRREAATGDPSGRRLLGFGGIHPVNCAVIVPDDGKKEMVDSRLGLLDGYDLQRCTAVLRRSWNHVPGRLARSQALF